MCQIWNLKFFRISDLENSKQIRLWLIFETFWNKDNFGIRNFSNDQFEICPRSQKDD